MKNGSRQYVVGIDEAGRGPLAGPVSVGAVCIRLRDVGKYFRLVKDSKRLSEKKREEWFEKIQTLKREGALSFAVEFSSEKIIDRHGIVPAISRALALALRKVVPAGGEKEVKVFLDGGLRAPSVFSHQETIIKGDEKIIVIALASIAAKVLRDRKMKALSKRYPLYGFDIHKGYGTFLHRKAIRKHGLSNIHRKTFNRLHKR